MALQSDGLPNIVKMLSAADADARCSAMWALSHLVHNAKPAVCEAVMAALPWEQFSPLLQDPDSTVQVPLSAHFLFDLQAVLNSQLCLLANDATLLVRHNIPPLPHLPQCVVGSAASLEFHCVSFSVPIHPFLSAGEELHDAAQHGCMLCVAQIK